MDHDHDKSDDRRRAARTRALLAGKVIVGDALFTANCTVVNLSATGARVRLSREAQLGLPLYLLFLRDGRLMECAVAWRSGDMAGLVFTAEHHADDDSPLRRRIHALWNDLRPR